MEEKLEEKSEEINSFKNILSNAHDTMRTFVRSTALAACYSNEDYEKWTGLGKSNVNNNLIKKWGLMVSNQPIATVQTVGRKAVRGPLNNGFYDLGMLLAASYKISRVSPNQIKLDFAILYYLQHVSELHKQTPVRISLVKTDLERLGYWSEENDIESDSARHTLQEYLADLLSFGVIKKTNDQYAPLVNFLDQLDESALYDLYDETQYYLKHGLLATPGYFLLEAIQQRLPANPLPTVFCFQEDYSYGIVEEDLIIDLLDAIHHNKVLKLSYIKANGRKYADEKDKVWYARQVNAAEVKQVVPLNIIRYAPYGRHYVQVWDIMEHQYVKLRIDRIDRIQAFTVIDEQPPRKSPACKTPDKTLFVTFSADTDAQLLSWLQRRLEQLEGTMVPIDHSPNAFMLTINNLDEIKPYLYACGTHLTILTTDINQWGAQLCASMREKAEKTLCAYNDAYPILPPLSHEASEKTKAQSAIASKSSSTLFNRTNNDIYHCIQEILMRHDSNIQQQTIKEIMKKYALVENDATWVKAITECVETIQDYIAIFHENAGTPISYQSIFPPSQLVQQFTRDLLSNCHHLFLKDDTVAKITACLDKNNIAPWSQEHVTSPALKPLSLELTEKIRSIRTAIREGRTLVAEDAQYMPCKLRYYVEQQQYYVLGWKKTRPDAPAVAIAETVDYFPATTLGATIAKEEKTTLTEDALIAALLAKESVTVKIVLHAPHMLERSFALLNQYNKAGYIVDEDKHHFTLNYFAFEEDALIRDLLSLNEYVVVQSPPRLRERLMTEWIALQDRYMS